MDLFGAAGASAGAAWSGVLVATLCHCVCGGTLQCQRILLPRVYLGVSVVAVTATSYLR